MGTVGGLHPDPFSQPSPAYSCKTATWNSPSSGAGSEMLSMKKKPWTRNWESWPGSPGVALELLCDPKRSSQLLDDKGPSSIA